MKFRVPWFVMLEVPAVLEALNCRVPTLSMVPVPMMPVPRMLNVAKFCKR